MSLNVSIAISVTTEDVTANVSFSGNMSVDSTTLVILTVDVNIVIMATGLDIPEYY